ncbi:TPA: hypothetical protein HA265_02795 [Candidatus Woesearchaeota archaeon]|nr:hypothetical protein [Candidatus Woesearchaeota archaeon]
MSGKNTTNYLIMLLAVILLISSSAAAITENFHAFSSKSGLDVCACDFTQQMVTVQNNGEVTSTYIVEQGGEAAKWTTLAPNTFYLEPGQIQEMENFIKVPCGAKGEYVLNTTIMTVFDLEKVIEQRVNVENCPNIQIVPRFSGVQQECPCTPVQYDFDIVNTGKHIDTYKLSVEPYSDGISLSTDYLVMEPGEKQTVTVFINLNCGEYGERTFTLNALAQGTQILGQMDFDLNINKCYDYQILVGEEYSICQGVPNVIDYQVENLAEISNEYFLTLVGPEWISSEDVSLPAWGGDTVNGEILLMPPLEDETTYGLDIELQAVRGEEYRTVHVSLISEKCYDYEIYGEKLTGIQCKERTDSLTIQNIGGRRTTYWLDLEGPEWLTLRKDMVVLDGGQEAEILFDINAPCDTEVAEFANTLYVTIDEVNQTYSQEHNVNVMPLEDAFLPDVDTTTVKTGYEGSEQQIKVTNTGPMWARYDLSVNSANWIWINEGSLELGSGETGYFTLATYPTEETAADGYKAEIMLAVEAEDIEYSTDLIVEVEQEKTVTDTLKENLLWIAIGGSLILLLIIILIVALVIKKGGKDKDKKGKKPETAAAIKEVKEEKVAKKAITIDKKEYARPKKEKEKGEKGKSRWPAILAIIIIVLLVGAGAYIAYKLGTGDIEIEGLESSEDQETAQEGMAEESIEETVPAAEPEPQEEAIAEPVAQPEEAEDRKLTEEDFEESLLVLDRSSVPGSGNELQVTNETEINLPLTIKNPTDRNAMFSVEQTEGSWIEFEREKLTVKPESEETINVKITPDHEALADHDYTATMNAKLEGKKIDYEETLEFTITKPNNAWLTWLLWGLGGLVALGLILLIIALSKRERKPKEKKPAKEEKKKEDKKAEKKAAAAKKAEKKTERKQKKDKSEGSIWPVVIIIVILGLIVGSLSFWAYNTLKTDDGQGSEEIMEEGTAEETVEEAVPVTEPEPQEEAEAEPVAEETQTEEAEIPEESKLTEEDVQESLITIDRSQVPGEGNELKVKDEIYTLPMTIKNPTDRTARFTVNTGNESWIVFDDYQILVDPEDIKDVDMYVVPDYDKLEDNDYIVRVNTHLAGEKIDYEEQLEFVISEENGGWPWWIWALIGAAVAGAVIGISELARRSKKEGAAGSGKKNASKKADIKADKKMKAAAKKKKETKDKDVENIDKEINRIRKKTELKIKKSSL